MQSHGQQAASGGPAKAGTFTTFDVPGAVAVNPVAINPSGTIAGNYFDAGDLIHSFLRARDGTITMFDPPGATCSLSTSNFCSAAVGITPEGTIIGSYQLISNGVNTFHGFLRAPDGTFTTIDPAGSAINPEGAITGSSNSHGFLRARGGTFTTFDPPGSTYTQPFAINPAGAITGFYLDASGATHGFLRAQHVRCTTGLRTD